MLLVIDQLGVILVIVRLGGEGVLLIMDPLV